LIRINILRPKFNRQKMDEVLPYDEI